MRIAGSCSNLTYFFLVFLSLPLVAAIPEVEKSERTHCITRPDKACLLIEGAQLPSTNGINFNARDELFVASVLDRGITQLDPDSGRIIAHLGVEQGVEAPDDLVFDNAGNLYWTAFLTGEVARLTPEGEKTTIADLGRGVNAITLSADESKLYVSRVFLADEVWEIDLSGINPPRLLAENIGGFNAMDVGSDGRLYGPLWDHGQVARIDTATGRVEVIAEGLDTPAAVKFNHAGELFVVDQTLGQVLRIDRGNGVLERVADVGIGADNLAFDSQDRLYVTNAHDSAVRCVSGSSHQINSTDSGSANCLHRGIDCNYSCPQNDFYSDTFRVSMLTRPGLTVSAGLALHNNNSRPSLFVADVYSVREYDPLSGHHRSVAHGVLGRTFELNTPFSLSSYGVFLLTTSWFANAVQIWDPQLQVVVDEYRDFTVPLNAIGFGDGIAVAELGSGCVMLQPADKSARIPLACDFKVPGGLAQSDGKLWVSDWATGSVWQIAENYKKRETPLLIVNGLQQPEGMAVTAKGTLLVVETGAHRLLEIDLSTATATTLVDELPIGNSATPDYPPTWIFNSVVVDDCGAVYLNADGDRSVRRVADKAVLLCEFMRQADAFSY